MTESRQVTPQTAGTPSQSSSVTPQQAGTQTTQATPNQAGAAQIDWNTVDWNTVDWDKHADKLPWDKIGFERIEKIPGVRKMQGTFEKKVRETARQAQQRIEALNRQLQQYEMLLSAQAGQSPEIAGQLDYVRNQGRQAELEAELAVYQEEAARKLLAAKHGIPEDVVFGMQGGPDEVIAQILDWQRENMSTKESSLQQQLADLKKQLDALSNRRTDPAANADVSVSVPSGNSYQVEWQNLMRDKKFAEANKLFRQAEAAGVEIDISAAKPSGWI